jgi:hypothetical protein
MLKLEKKVEFAGATFCVRQRLVDLVQGVTTEKTVSKNIERLRRNRRIWIAFGIDILVVFQLLGHRWISIR